MSDRFSPEPHVAGPRLAESHPAGPRLADPHPAGAPAVERLAQYSRAEQEEVLGPGDDPYGVAYTGLAFLPKEIHHTGLLPLPLTAGGTDLTVMGVGGVCVAPDRRGGGLAHAVVGAALDHARVLGHRHALLFCRPPLAAFYRGLGFREVAEEVTVEQPERRLAVMPLRTMWTPLVAGAGWPEGPVRLRSLPM